MVEFIWRWRIAAVYLAFVLVVGWAAWVQDRANADQVARVDRMLVSCRSTPPVAVTPVPVPQPVSRFD